MPIDASVYANANPTPDIMGSIMNGMKMRDMIQQQQIKQRGLNTQNAINQAIVQDPATGQLTWDGSKVGDLGNVDKMQLLQAQGQIGQQQRAVSEAQLKDWQLKLGIGAQILGSVKDQDSFTDARNKLIGHGIYSPEDIPQQYEKDWVSTHMDAALDRKTQIDNHIKQQTADAATTKADADKMEAQAKIAALGPDIKEKLFGRSSPTTALASEYDKEVAPIKSSQIAMRQMMDNYDNKSPQGDASLVLNAFKIKFPNAPDVNSLEELSKAQAVPDQWKNMAAHALSGGLDQNTRDNLMRDGVSTYRANYGTYQDIAQKYQGMANQRKIPLGGMTDEPALDNTFAKSQEIQKKIGPYVPPSERGGIMSGVMNAAASVMGGGPAAARAGSTPQYRPGSIVAIGGKHYTVGADGDTLVPVTGKR